MELEEKIETEDSLENNNVEETIVEESAPETIAAPKEPSLFVSNLINVAIMLVIAIIGYLVFDMVILRVLGYKFIKAYMGTGILVAYVLVTAIYPVFKKNTK